MLEERTGIGAVARMDRFHARELGCEIDALRRPGQHLVVSDRRARPGWGGYSVPILALSTSVGGVISCRRDLISVVRQELDGIDQGISVNAVVFDRLRRATRRGVPYAYSLNGYALYCDAEHFQPTEGDAERLARDDRRGLDLRRRFDGEIFVVTGARGEIAAWSAIKLKSDDVWEIAVVTEAPYRGRGYAKQVVSAATRHILDSGRLPLYVHDRANHASARVCRALGYVEYAEEFFCEY